MSLNTLQCPGWPPLEKELVLGGPSTQAESPWRGWKCETEHIEISQKTANSFQEISWVFVTHTCNPGYLGGSKFEASWGKWFLRPHLQNNQSKNGLVLGTSGSHL
jgi:hypothetical protein